MIYMTSTFMNLHGTGLIIGHEMVPRRGGRLRLARFSERATARSRCVDMYAAVVVNNF
jgi:hypothetical protein